MKTELVIEEHKIIAGRKIGVLPFIVSNFRIHQVCEQYARLLPFMLEMDSNNMAATVKPSDVAKIRAQWEAVKAELAFAKLHNDVPTGSLEQEFKVYLITGEEIQRVRNAKIKRVLAEIHNSSRYMIECDSARNQNFLSDYDHVEIEKSFKVVDAVMDLWIGKSDGSDSGLFLPQMNEVGEIVPDVDGDYSQTKEPSSEAPTAPIPDTPDV